MGHSRGRGGTFCFSFVVFVSFGVLFGVLSAWCIVMFVFCMFLFCVALVFILSDCLRPPAIVSKNKTFSSSDRRLRSDSRR